MKAGERIASIVGEQDIETGATHGESQHVCQSKVIVHD
jgi:hypothetical protein